MTYDMTWYRYRYSLVAWCSLHFLYLESSLPGIRYHGIPVSSHLQKFCQVSSPAWLCNLLQSLSSVLVFAPQSEVGAGIDVKSPDIWRPWRQIAGVDRKGSWWHHRHHIIPLIVSNLSFDSNLNLIESNPFLMSRCPVHIMVHVHIVHLTSNSTIRFS